MVAISTSEFLDQLAAVTAQVQANRHALPALNVSREHDNLHNGSHDDGDSPLHSYYIEPIVISGTIIAKKPLTASNKGSRWARIRNHLLGQSTKLSQDHLATQESPDLLNNANAPECSSKMKTSEEETENEEEIFHDCNEHPDRAPTEQATGEVSDTDDINAFRKLATGPVSETGEMDRYRKEKAWDAWWTILSNDKYSKPRQTLEQKKSEHQRSDVDHL